MRKIAIVARGGTNCLAPFRDKEWEIWGLPWISYPRIDRVFDLHSQRFYDEQPYNWLSEGAWLRRHIKEAPDAIAYCEKSRMRLFPNAVEFPFEKVFKEVPFNYFENSIAYMLGLAIVERVDEIGLWGVHMYAGAEAELAHSSVTYLIGLAQGRGIKVTVAPGSPLFMSNYTAGRYGVTGGPNMLRPKIISYAGVTPYS